MIHVLTVHWKRPAWIKLQLDYLQRFISAPYRSYCYYTDIEPVEVQGFDQAMPTAAASHPAKLNKLADIAIHQSDSDQDILLFIDGDAFPIRPVVEPIASALSTTPLLAIQRFESGGDLQPHPSFCATTTGFWKEIGGDWNAGYQWVISNGQLRTDVGGNLLGKLLEKDISWQPLLRTRGLADHGMYFGVYGDLVYHHGAGFRDAWSTYDLLQMDFGRVLHRFTPNRLWPLVSRVVPTRSVTRRNNRISARVFQEISSEPDFFDKFFNAQPPPGSIS